MRTEPSAWMEGYDRAWSSNDPAAIAALFTDDARYSTSPTEPPWAGSDAIVGNWLERRDEPADWTFRWPEGRCSGFTEWWVEARTADVGTVE